MSTHKETTFQIRKRLKRKIVELINSRSYQKDIPFRATHEAGHVAALFLLNERCWGASAWPTLWENHRRGPFISYGIVLGSSQDPYKEAMINLAGLVATDMAGFDESNGIAYARYDFESFSEQAAELGLPDEFPSGEYGDNPFYDEIYATTRAMLVVNEAFLIEIAQGLIDNAHLSHKDLERIADKHLRHTAEKPSKIRRKKPAAKKAA